MFGTLYNSAAPLREAFAIYVSVEILSFYIWDAECTILCDYKPVEKFLKGKQKLTKATIGP